MCCSGLEILPPIPFVAVGHHYESSDGKHHFVIDSCYRHVDIYAEQFQDFAARKLRDVTTDVSFVDPIF